MILSRLSTALQHRATGRVTLAATVLFILFLALVLPGQAAKAQAVAGDAGAPDTAFWYTPADLYRMAEAYGPEDRQAYIGAAAVCGHGKQPPLAGVRRAGVSRAAGPNAGGSRSVQPAQRYSGPGG